MKLYYGRQMAFYVHEPYTNLHYNNADGSLATDRLATRQKACCACYRCWPVSRLKKIASMVALWHRKG